MKCLKGIFAITEASANFRNAVFCSAVVKQLQDVRECCVSACISSMEARQRLPELEQGSWSRRRIHNWAWYWVGPLRRGGGGGGEQAQRRRQLVCRLRISCSPSDVLVMVDLQPCWMPLVLRGAVFAAIVALHRDYVAIFRYRFGQNKVVPQLGAERRKERKRPCNKRFMVGTMPGLRSNSRDLTCSARNPEHPAASPLGVLS